MIFSFLILDLAVGNTMNEFSWKSGGKLEDKSWDSHLPTDAEVSILFYHSLRGFNIIYYLLVN